MDKTSEKLTVYFEEPFWVGVFERVDNNKLSVCKVTFGAEPKDYEIWEFILKYYYDLKFSPVVETEIKQVADNPKRRSRNARKQVKTQVLEPNHSTHSNFSRRNRRSSIDRSAKSNGMPKSRSSLN